MVFSIETAVQNVKSGRTEEFESIIEHFQQPLFRYCYHMLGNIHEAEDAVQESFLSAYEKIGCFQSSLSFSAWLYKITYHHCINRINRRNRIRFIPFLERPETGDHGLESDLEGNELGKTLAKALERISPSERSVLILRALEEKSFEEIGNALGIKPAAARKRYERARKKAKTILAGKQGGIFNEGLQTD